MPKVILICGKICSGKSTYAQKLRAENKAVVLSSDEVMLSLFEHDLGDMHDEVAEKVHRYLFDKSIEIIRAGADVILEWGFWQKKDREYAVDFYKSRGIDCEFHYIEVPDGLWEEYLKERNQKVLEGKDKSYFVDDGLAQKLERLFEKPDPSEMDVWFVNDGKLKA